MSPSVPKSVEPVLRRPVQDRIRLRVAKSTVRRVAEYVEEGQRFGQLLHRCCRGHCTPGIPPGNRERRWDQAIPLGGHWIDESDVVQRRAGDPMVLGKNPANLQPEVLADQVKTIAGPRGRIVANLDAIEVTTGMWRQHQGRARVDNARDATQVFGGYGFIDEFTVARHYRDSKILEVGEGTTEVQLMLIAREAGL